MPIIISPQINGFIIQYLYTELYFILTLFVSFKQLIQIADFVFVAVIDDEPDDEIEESNQSDDYPYKPFNAPIDFKKASITSYFAQERIVYDNYNIHYAWDLAAPAKTPVYSVGEGTVKTVRFNQSSNSIDTSNGLGNYIEIDYEIEGKHYRVIYGHLYPNSSKVKVGDQVKSWQEIASVGTTGYSTGNHLHFQVSLNNNKIDGMNLIDFNLQYGCSKYLRDKNWRS